jgi:1,4-alpha-glucan branching enzyme
MNSSARNRPGIVTLLCTALAASGMAQAPNPWVPGLTRLSDTEVLLALEAPGKGKVNAVGDFNGWSATANPMSKDGDRFWVRIGGLSPGKEYVYQYWIDDAIKIGDPYAAKVVDYVSDPEIIEEGSYPGLIRYARESDGPASAFTAGPAPASIRKPFVKPDPENLLIYETLVRDYAQSHTFAELRDSLPYFKRLGINALELMPVMEFEGNVSWGYNPSYVFAVDKYYGPADELKKLIQAAHEQGVAVILDVVLNHAMGQHPLIRMFWDEAAGKPAAGNPFANLAPKHDFNVGWDLNYESAFTRSYYKRLLQYWIREFQADGYRIDLSKGLTQNNTLGDIAAWGRLDLSRVAILDDLAGAAREADPDVYLILEHFADNDEETLLASKGFMLWGNSAFDHGYAIAGRVDVDFDWAYSGNRGWPARRLVSYMESHDEERLVHQAEMNGLGNGSYDAKEPGTALERAKMAALFLFGIPGPKMMWQFGEWGDDRAVGATPEERMGKKPLPAEYRRDPARKKLWDAYAGLLRFRRLYPDAFRSGTFSWKPDGAVRTWRIAHAGLNAFAVGNFSVTPDKLAFDRPGTWYDYFTREKFTLSSSAEIALKPGEYHLWTDRPVFAEAVDVSAFPVPASLNPEKAAVSLARRPDAPALRKTAFRRDGGMGLTVIDARGGRWNLAGRSHWEKQPAPATR